MTKLFSQCLIDYQYGNPNSSDELAALRKMIRAVTDYDTAYVAHKCATSSLEDYTKEGLQALDLMARHAKTFDEHYYVALQSAFGTAQYFKALEKAQKKTKHDYDTKRIEKLAATRARRAIK